MCESGCSGRACGVAAGGSLTAWLMAEQPANRQGMDANSQGWSNL